LASPFCTSEECSYKRSKAVRGLRDDGARRVLFLVDRRTLGRQALNEFQQFSIPGDGRKFTEIYNVRQGQRLLPENHLPHRQSPGLEAGQA
jgi:type I site-specific restriction-modification system R (restriction) subunit